VLTKLVLFTIFSHAMLNGEQLKQLRTAPRSGNRVRLARELAGLTQVQMAEQIGYTQPFISSIENGRYGDGGLPTETSRRLAEFFDCFIEDLFPASSPTARAV
jgi:transcriptional regulator with XRE-family HTH domain